jgi:phosphatidylglycerol---prolipoprotein diacylglyceryl transferase
LNGFVLLSIPSPSSPVIATLGPFTLRWYGTLIAIGILLAGWIVKRELIRRGLDGEAVYTIAMWCVPFGVVGARLYHIATDWGRFSSHLDRLLQIWQGGLGLPGVIAGGALGAWIGARRVGIRPLVVFDAIAPGLIAAQALGRWGNYFNQELFGGPTSLPWALEISPSHRPAGYAQYTTFHPTFLYESLWDALVFVALLVLIRRWWRWLPAGGVFAAYLAGYSFGRFWIEGLRIDTAQYVAGVRFNQVLFGVVCLAAAGWFAWAFRRARRARDADAALSAVPPGREASAVGPHAAP